MSLRERGLVVLTVVAVVIALWHETLVVALDRSNERLTAQVRSAEAKVQAEQTTQQEVLAAFKGDPNERLRAAIQGANDELVTLTRRLEGVTKGLVPPERMTALLDDVMSRHPGVRLVRAENLPPERLVSRTSDAAAEDAGEGDGTGDVAAAADAMEAAFYRHGLRLELEGGYGDVVAWLDTMEGLAWQFAWQSLRYEVVDHPLARVTVEVQTVSTEDRWIGIEGDRT